MTAGHKRLVFFIATLGSGGAERVVSMLSKTFVEKGLDVDIVYYYDAPIFYSLDERVRIVCVEKETKSRNILKNILWLRKYLQDNADIVVSFLTKFNMFALCACLGTGISVVVSERTDPKKAFGIVMRMTRDYLYRYARAIVAQTNYAKSCFGRKLQNKISVIYNPVDVGNLKGKALKSQKIKTIVSVGRLIPVKNQKLIIDAFAKIANDYPEYRLVIYGEGECRTSLESRISEYGLSHRIILPGNNNDILNVICNAELFILSSNYEGMPNALLEAMCLGLPVISTKVAGATDVIDSGLNGLLVDVDNEDKMISAMYSMLENKVLRETCGINAVKMNDVLNKNLIVGQWLDLIGKI